MILDLEIQLTWDQKIILNITFFKKNHGSKSGQCKPPANFTWLDYYRFSKILQKISNQLFYCLDFIFLLLNFLIYHPKHRIIPNMVREEVVFCIS